MTMPLISVTPVRTPPATFAAREQALIAARIASARKWRRRRRFLRLRTAMLGRRTRRPAAPQNCAPERPAFG